MSELNIYYSQIAHDLSREKNKVIQKLKAQKYLIQACENLDQPLIDISVAFGGNLLLSNSQGIAPIDILKDAEQEKNKKNKENKKR